MANSVSLEPILLQHFASNRVTDYIVNPVFPLDRDQATELFTKSLAFVELFISGFFESKSKTLQAIWDKLAKRARDKLEFYRPYLAAPQEDKNTENARMRLWNHIFGQEDERKPITVLLSTLNPRDDPCGSASAARDMVGFVYGKMIYASKDVEQASRLVLCGFRDWAKLNRWQRINVALAAKDYYHEKRKVAKARHATRNAATASTTVSNSQYSLGRHVPSLTARQHRRNGVSEMELRARWGGGGIV